MLTILVGFILLSTYAYQDLNQLSTLKDNVLRVKTVAHLINELQKERGLTSGFLANQSNITKVHLNKQRNIVNTVFQQYLHIEQQKKSTTYKEYQQLIEKLYNIRAQISHFQMTTIQAFDYYTQLIAQLQNSYMNLIVRIEDTNLKNDLQVYTNLALMKESLGQIRGAFNGIFSLKFTEGNLLYRVIHAKGMYDSALYQFEATAPDNIYKKYQELTLTDNYQWILQTIKKYSLQYLKSTQIDPTKWWKNATTLIDELYRFEMQYFESIDNYVSQKSKNIFQNLIINTFLLLTLTLFILWLSIKIKNNIVRSINLLNQYKNVVDTSSIVSKTNRRGIITYANEQFSKISGYSLEELLGKPHNLVRHQDMPKEAFREMWQTILNKKSWRGIVKNRKKDGSYYIVEATINPILDEYGNIEEFIAIRNDITEVVQLHEEVEQTQQDLIFKMSELTETRSKETGFHVRRVAKYSEILARHYGLNEDEIKRLTLASPMHDIGKVGIEDTILHKPSKLTQEEWEIMKTHTTIGYNLFKDSDKPLLQAAATIAHEHHERYDGSGYPRGLKGKEIHIFARITAIADTFDALNSKRSYKTKWDDKDIFKYMKEEAGSHFDPELIDLFFKHIDLFIEVRDHYQDSSDFMKE